MHILSYCHKINDISVCFKFIEIIGTFKRDFIIEEEIARHFVQYSVCLSYFVLPSLLCNSNNKPFS